MNFQDVSTFWPYAFKKFFNFINVFQPFYPSPYSMIPFLEAPTLNLCQLFDILFNHVIVSAFNRTGVDNVSHVSILFLKRFFLELKFLHIFTNNFKSKLINFFQEIQCKFMGFIDMSCCDRRINFYRRLSFETIKVNFLWFYLF